MVGHRDKDINGSDAGDGNAGTDDAMLVDGQEIVPTH
jgi:hypothetical protein